MNVTAPPRPDLDALRTAGAARVDAVGWHYIETLALRMQAQSGPAKRLLQAKLQDTLQRFEARMNAAGVANEQPAASPEQPSPMATLLQDMQAQSGPQASEKTAGWPAENPRIQQFRKQLSQISVQKQVTQAIAQAPQNAGPINSHMLVLRSLGLMRDISPNYLNRFMAHVDTLLCLDEADKGKLTPKKAGAAAKNRP
jgi:hypothetical protein